MLRSVAKFFSNLKKQPKIISAMPASTEWQEANLVSWIEALLSGEYKQGLHKLYNPVTGCHCATGVFVDKFGFPHVDGVYYYGCNGAKDDLLESKLSIPRSWAANVIGNQVEISDVVLLNDGGWTFPQIAGFLLTYLPEGPKRTDLQNRVNEQIKAQTDLTVA